MASRLVFTESRHTYALDGVRVPGVTTVIGKAHDKPALVGAAAKVTALYAAEHVADKDAGTERWVADIKGHYRAKWNASGRRGTLLHDAARQLVAGDPLMPVDINGEPWPEDVIRSAQQLARFMDQWDMQPSLTERPVFHEAHGWAGTMDAVAVLRDGQRWLLDYKTGETGIYPKDALQLAAYRHASHVQVVAGEELEDQPMPEVDRAACVWVRPDFYELRPVRADMESYAVFLAMLPVARWTDWKVEASVGEPVALGKVAL